MMKVEVSRMEKKLLRDFDDSYIFLQDSQDVKSVLEYIGTCERFPYLLVKLDSSGADYAEVWGTFGWKLYDIAYRLK
ncbi:hypothetical protein YS40_084 [Thermus phage phiYS40]|uniref:hypothetical protein n=1 Tax=Thermus phage phiYS40 TaxID=407392 RepID=UPI0000E689CA|nr:hypothetical protein YS40_084 [Thermus phage phiYS40]ABJ91478.1 hypothetical protein YS40_084 [Thermus phage phiYS40]BAK53602.1 hypothetical protein YSP_084 [Thermus phage phiYS40]